jgi:hypothetical protein
MGALHASFPLIAKFCAVSVVYFNDVKYNSNTANQTPKVGSNFLKNHSKAIFFIFSVPAIKNIQSDYTRSN